jgi:hypothetical protein
MDVPDSAANARVFGYPGTKPGTKVAFPKARLVLLIETSTHFNPVKAGLVQQPEEWEFSS